MSLLSSIGAIGSGVSGLLNTAGNIWSSHKQWQLGNETLGWQKQAQEKTWEREDNAVQRRAADLNAAGMNRLLAAGSGAASSAPVHVGTPDAMDLSGLGNGLGAYIETKMALNKQRADIAHTDAQRKLLEGQLSGVQKQNALLQKQLDWYKDHPNSAPGVPGMASPNMFERVGEFLTDLYTKPESTLLGRLASRAGNWLGERWYNYTHPNRPVPTHYKKQ